MRLRIAKGAMRLALLAGTAVLAACASSGHGGGGGSGGGSFTIAQPARATNANPGSVVTASVNGPTFTGAGGTPNPANGTVFPFTQTAVAKNANGITADTATNTQGMSITVIDAGNGVLEFKVPALGIDQQVTSNASGDTRITSGTQAGNYLTLSSGNLDWVVLGFWGLLDSTDSNVLNAGYGVSGYQTPTANVPTTGTASYTGTGTVVGTVLTPGTGSGKTASLSGDASFTANFGTGMVTGALTNIMATPDNGGSAAAWNSVSASATISGSTFSGTTAVTASPSGTYTIGSGATGYIDGGFYGPNAEELGAVWSLYDGTNAAIGTVAAKQGGGTLQH